MARLEAWQRAPRSQQRVLDGVLRVLDRAEHPVAVSLELTPVRLGEIAEGVLAAPARRLQQLSFLGASGCRGGGHYLEGTGRPESTSGSPKAGNSSGGKVVISAITPCSMRITSSASARYSASPGCCAVAADRRLHVGSRHDAGHAPEALLIEALGPVLDDHLAADEQARLRRHREAQVLVQGLEHRLRVGVLGRLEIAVEQLALLARRFRGGRPLEPPLGQILLEAGAGALQRAVD